MKWGLKGGISNDTDSAFWASWVGMYFDAVVVEVRTFLLLFRLAPAILCNGKWCKPKMNNPRWTNFEMNNAGTDNTGMSLGENHVLRIHIVLFISQYYCIPLTLNTRRGGSGMQPQIFPVREANYIHRSNPNWHEGWYFYLLVLFGSDFVRIFIKNSFGSENWHQSLMEIFFLASKIFYSY